MSAIDLKKQSISEMFKLYDEISKQLEIRKIIRTRNSPVGDYAELLVCRALGLTIEVNKSQKHRDAVSLDRSTRYQIKGRRLGGESPSRRVGAIRELKSGKHFDFLAGVLFNGDFTVDKGCLVPHELVAKRAGDAERTNSSAFHLTDAVWKLPGVRDITAELKDAARDIEREDNELRAARE